MTREEEIRKAIDTIFPIPSYEKGRKYEQALMATGFEAGVKWADEHPKSPWISVKDDLPCNHKELLMDNKQCPKTFKVFVTNIYSENWSDYMIYKNGKWRWNSYEPDYWMPAPKLPK